MQTQLKSLFFAVMFVLASMLFLISCSHTVQGMKQDIHEASGPDQQPKKTAVVKTTVVKKTVVVPAGSSTSLPSSPPPLQTPAN